MDASLLACRLTGIALLCVPLVATAQGLLRGPEPSPPRQKADPPEVQSVKLPSGQLMKRLPGDSLAAGPAAPALAAAVPGMTVQQVGNAQMRVLNAPGMISAPEAARQTTELTVRQVGQVRVLEARGERAPGLPATAPVAAPPAGVAIVDLPPGQAPPVPPAANTLYRRVPAGG